MNPYGLTLALAIFVSYSLTAYRAKKRGLSTQIVWDSLPWVLVFGILGARLYHILNYWSYYSQNPVWILEVWRGGLGIFGGLIGGLIGYFLFFFGRENYTTLHSVVYFFMRGGSGVSVRIKFDRGIFWSYLDAAAPVVALGQALGRVGNVFNNENLPYAWWEITLNLVIFLSLLLYECIKRGWTSKGIFNFQFSIFNQITNVSIFKLYILLYFLGRFGLEFFRTDSPWVWGPLTVAQWVCLVVFLSVFLTRIIKHLLRYYVVTKKI